MQVPSVATRMERQPPTAGLMQAWAKFLVWPKFPIQGKAFGKFGKNVAMEGLLRLLESCDFAVDTHSVLLVL